MGCEGRPSPRDWRGRRSLVRQHGSRLTTTANMRLFRFEWGLAISAPPPSPVETTVLRRPGWVGVARQPAGPMLMDACAAADSVERNVPVCGDFLTWPGTKANSLHRTRAVPSRHQPSGPRLVRGAVLAVRRDRRRIVSTHSPHSNRKTLIPLEGSSHGASCSSGFTPEFKAPTVELGSVLLASAARC